MDFAKISQWLATSPIASYLRSFLAVFLFQAMTEIVAVGKFDFTNLEHWAITALAAGLPTFLRWINPQDPAFGRGS